MASRRRDTRHEPHRLDALHTGAGIQRHGSDRRGTAGQSARALLLQRMSLPHRRTVQRHRGFGSAYGNFTIGESAYIRSTGHFNAVELILCFNQLAYSAFAPAVLNEEIRVLRGWSIDDYCQHQLSSMLIRKASSRFRKPLNPQSSLPASCVEICRSSNEPGAISRSRASSSSGTRTAGRRPVRSN